MVRISKKKNVFGELRSSISEFAVLLKKLFVRLKNLGDSFYGVKLSHKPDKLHGAIFRLDWNPVTLVGP